MKNTVFILAFLISVFSVNAQSDTTVKDPGIDPPEKVPEFPGGNDSLYKFIAKNLVYPKKARKNNITGKVYAQFIIQKNGVLDSIKIIRGLGHGCDEEVVRVLKLMPKWKPGKQNGRPVAVKFTLPVAFKLEEK